MTHWQQSAMSMMAGYEDGSVQADVGMGVTTELLPPDPTRLILVLSILQTPTGSGRFEIIAPGGNKVHYAMLTGNSQTIRWGSEGSLVHGRVFAVGVDSAITATAYWLRERG